MNIALTGASGFVGQNLTKALVVEGYNLKVLYHNKPPLDDALITPVKGSLSDYNALAELVRGADIVIHCAALVSALNRKQYFEVNVQGTQNIVDATKRSGAGRFLLISSLAAREPGLSDYSSSKYESEQCLINSDLEKWDVLRPPAVYGPGDEGVLELVKIVNKGVALLPAGRDARISVVNVRDLVAAIMVWIRAEKTTQSVYEVSGPEEQGYLWPDLMEVMATVLGRKVRYVAPPLMLLHSLGAMGSFWSNMTGRKAFLSSGKVSELSHPDWVCDIENFRNVFSFQPNIRFEDGFSEAVIWYREQKLL